MITSSYTAKQSTKSRGNLHVWRKISVNPVLEKKLVFVSIQIHEMLFYFLTRKQKT